MQRLAASGHVTRDAGWLALQDVSGAELAVVERFLRAGIEPQRQQAARIRDLPTGRTPADRASRGPLIS
jgi:hypothetical protein